jgi:hypothetical protein
MSASIYDEKTIRTSNAVQLLGETPQPSPVWQLSTNVQRIEPFRDLPTINFVFNLENGSARVEAPDSNIIKSIMPVKKDVGSAKSHPLMLSYRVNQMIEGRSNIETEATRRTLLAAVFAIENQSASILFSKLKNALNQDGAYTYVDAFGLYAQLNLVRSSVMTVNQDQSMLYYVVLPQSLYLAMSAKPATKDGYMSQADEFMQLCSTGMIEVIISSFADTVMIYDQSKITHYEGAAVNIVAGDPILQGTYAGQSTYVIQGGTHDIIKHADVIGSSFPVSIS